MHNAFGSGLSLPAPICPLFAAFLCDCKGVFLHLGFVVGWIAKSLCRSAARVWIVLIRLIRGMIRSHNEIIMNRYFSQSSERKVFFFFLLCGEWVYPLTFLTVLFSSRSVEEWPEMALNSRRASCQCEMQGLRVRPAPRMHQKPGWLQSRMIVAVMLVAFQVHVFKFFQDWTPLVAVDDITGESW